MSMSIPPLNPLRVFEAVARLGNLTKAAEELHVTQSAVSRQIGVLENYLEVRLFVREARGVSLTKQGLAFQNDIAPAFAQISLATKKLRGTSSEKPLKVRAYTTFSAKWLLRYMHRFEELYPWVEVRLSSSVEPVHFEKEDVDLAIQFGDGMRTDVHCIKLFDDVIEPVCSPLLLKGEYPLTSLDNLKHHKLLHSRYRTDDWPDWLSANGQSDLQLRPKSTLPSSLLAYQASIEGLGVAIGQIRLLEPDLESGVLVRPFKLPLSRKLGYYALMPRNRSLTQADLFLEWLQSEVKLMGY